MGVGVGKVGASRTTGAEQVHCAHNHISQVIPCSLRKRYLHSRYKLFFFFLLKDSCFKGDNF